MFVESLWEILGWARTPSDAQLSLRPNYGVGMLASVFGCGVSMGDNDMPWVASRPEKAALLEIDLSDLPNAGLIPKCREFIALAREQLKPVPDIHVFVPDLQGPMNTAFLLRQQDIFLEMLDDEAWFRRLMDTITDVFVRLTRVFKADLGEPETSGYHGALYMDAGGVRVVDDVSVMLSKAQYEDYSFPYVVRCLEPFEGGWIHSCGNISHLLDVCLAAPEVKGINFGEPEYYDFEHLMPRLAESHTFCYGGPVRRPGESVEGYLARTAGYVRGFEQTLIFMPRYQGQDMSEGDWPVPDELLAMWLRACAADS